LVKRHLQNKYAKLLERYCDRQKCAVKIMMKNNLCASCPEKNNARKIARMNRIAGFWGGDFW